MFQGLLCLIIVHFQGKSINSQHKGKNDNRQCKLCGEECESVVHVLWQCPVYDTIRNLLRGGRSSEEFSTLNNFKKTASVFRV